MSPGVCYVFRPQEEYVLDVATSTFSRGSSDFNFEIDDDALSDLFDLNVAETTSVTVQITAPPISGRFGPRYEGFCASGTVIGWAIVTDPDPTNGHPISAGQTITVEICRA